MRKLYIGIKRQRLKEIHLQRRDLNDLVNEFECLKVSYDKFVKINKEK